MRTIAKGEEPRDLLDWKRDNQTTPQNLTFRAGGFPGEAVRRALLDEQLHLCAYTLKALKTSAQCEAQGQGTSQSCHIEHWLPQSRKIDAETIDFQNMLACFPGSHVGGIPYGAHFKGGDDTGVNALVSPLSPRAEQHFKFYRDGTVEGLSQQGRATIAALCLDHATLNNDRAAVIKGRLEPKTGKPISAAAARRLAQEVFKPNAQRCLPAFCVAIAQAALIHAEREERRASRLKKKATP